MADRGSFFAELEARGLIHQVSESSAGPSARELLDTPGQCVYAGFDPTAPSLHVGHLIPILGLRRFQQAGHRVIALAGGATGLVGDPSGKSEERNMLAAETLRANVAAVKGQLEQLLDFEGENPALLVDNLDWTQGLTLLDFLRDVGKHFSINAMLRKDSVRNRLGALSLIGLGRRAVEELVADGKVGADAVGAELEAVKGLHGKLSDAAEETSISFTEFSYMLLQGFDFLHLFRTQSCNVQVGGSDQWGNITCGTELVRRITGEHAHALTFPLLTNSDGSKFGKTVAGAVWLDPAMTSPFAFRQFWFNTSDADVVHRLRYFTFLPLDEIAELAATLDSDPQAVKRRLAREMTALVHGEAEAAKVEQAIELFFGGGDLRDVPPEYIEDALGGAPVTELPRERFAGDGVAWLELVTTAVSEGGKALSKGAARRLVQQSSLALNGEKLADPERAVTGADLIHDRYLVLKKGKKHHFLVKAVG